MQVKLPHKNWVSGARWCGGAHPHLIATSCYDGAVRLWDIRSTIPLHTLSKHDGKATCLVWEGGERVVSGGEDAQVMRAELSLPSS